MSWIQENKVPAAVLGVTGVGVLGLGYVLYGAWSSASEKKDTFDSTNSSLVSLKSAKLAPTEQNLAAKSAAVTEYSAAVTSLYKLLHDLQPKVTALTGTEFQAKLKAKAADIRKLGDKRLPADFNLTFEKYNTELPQSDEQATELSGYLDSVDAITRLLLNSGVLSIVSVERSLLASEGGAPAKPAAAPKGGKPGAAAPSKATERRQVTVVLNTDQAALQILLSRLASPSEMDYFTVVRRLRIENQAKEGPVRTFGTAAVDPTGATAAPAAGAEATKVETVAGAPTPATPGPAAIIATQPAPPDSRIVLGDEKLKVYLEIDLVTFTGPQAAAATR